MAEQKTYKEGDLYKGKYPHPLPPNQQYRIGQAVSIREQGVLVAMCEITKTDESGYEGKITKVFLAKVPTDPRQAGPTPPKRSKPL